MKKPALCLAAPLPRRVPGDELSTHAAVANVGSSEGVCALRRRAGGRAGLHSHSWGQQQQDSQRRSVFGSRVLRRICHQGWQEGPGLGQPGRRQDDARAA